MNTIFFALAIAPSIALVLFIYHKDQYEREPILLLFSVFIFGVLTVVPILLVEGLLSRLNFFSGIYSILFISFVIAGFTEEYFKRFVVLKIAYRNRNYNEKLDGIVYCVMASLGFATVENLMYVLGAYKGNLSVGISRAFLSVPAHMLFGVSMGYYLSLSKYANSEEEIRKNYRKSLIIPIVLHGTFNFILLSGSEFLMLIFLPYILYLWKFNLKKIKQYKEESKKNNEDIIEKNS